VGPAQVVTVRTNTTLLGGDDSVLVWEALLHDVHVLVVDCRGLRLELSGVSLTVLWVEGQHVVDLHTHLLNREHVKTERKRLVTELLLPGVKGCTFDRRHCITLLPFSEGI